MKLPKTFRMEKDLSENVERLLKFKKEPKTKPVDIPGYLTLENISCTDSEGNVFEHYDKLYVAKDVYKEDNRVVVTSFDNAISKFEELGSGSFVPSLALSCNILAKLYENRNNPEINNILMQYKDSGLGHGRHIQNTIVDWRTNKIIHYPSNKDLEMHSKINQNKPRKVFDFNINDFLEQVIDPCELSLGHAFKEQSFKKYIQNLTGLQDLEVLVQIGEHFSYNSAKIWLPSLKLEYITPRQVTLGCPCTGWFRFVVDASMPFKRKYFLVRGVKQ